MFGVSATVAKVLDDSARKTGYPILILRERGTGKTALARHIHGLSGRSGSFIRESAAAIPEHLEVAHLGGHARGAYMGDQLPSRSTVQSLATIMLFSICGARTRSYVVEREWKGPFALTEMLSFIVKPRMSSRS